MGTGQLWLFPPPKPLVERLGEDFFHQLPSKPGVYLMYGEAGVLYVGKARNLRKRLSSYRVANSERLPRRIIRLLFQVTKIEFDLCLDERASIYREEMLIAVLGPKFNRRGNVWVGKADSMPVHTPRQFTIGPGLEPEQNSHSSPRQNYERNHEIHH